MDRKHASGASYAVAASFTDFIARREIDDAPPRDVKSVGIRLDLELLR